MCLFGNLPFSTVSPARPGCHEIFILFFDDDPAWGFIYFRLWIKEKGVWATKENRRCREARRRRSRKNHDAIIFVPARERILRSSGLDRWTEKEKKERRKAEGQKEGLTSSSGRVRDKDVKVVEGMRYIVPKSGVKRSHRRASWDSETLMAFLLFLSGARE